MTGDRILVLKYSSYIISSKYISIIFIFTGVGQKYGNTCKLHAYIEMFDLLKFVAEAGVRTYRRDIYNVIKILWSCNSIMAEQIDFEWEHIFTAHIVGASLSKVVEVFSVSRGNVSNINSTYLKCGKYPLNNSADESMFGVAVTDDH